MENNQKEKVVEGFEKIRDSTLSFLSQLKEDADRSLKLLRLKGESSQIKRRIDSQYQTLGEATYKQIAKKKLKEPALEQLAREITRLFKELKKNQKKIAEMSKEAPSPSATVKAQKARKTAKETAAKKGRS